MQPAALICSLLWQIKKYPKVKNVLHYNNLIECLDLRLTEIDLIDYRGNTSEIKLASFFVLETSVLKVMRFGVLWRNNEWRADRCSSALSGVVLSPVPESPFLLWRDLERRR